MRIVLVVYCALAAAAVAGLLAALLLRRLHLGRRRRRDAELARQYLRIVVGASLSEESEIPFFPRLYCFGGRLVLAETLARLAASTYGFDREFLRRIVEQAGIGRYLMRRVRRTGGYRRAWFLALLSRLPVDEPTVQAAARYAGDRNRCVRFYVLSVQIACEPAKAPELMAAYPDPFSAFELGELMGMLRRGILPLAYKSLIRSAERNLRSLGLCIVRQLCIEEAEASLLRIVAADEAPELGREALYTLCAMQRPLRRREVALRISVMNGAERKALLRYMAFEGYAGGVLDGVFGSEETPYFEALVSSYKRPLACS